MSYDLYFRTRQGAEAPNMDRLRAYFSQVPHFELKSNSEVYSNEDTGVYFNFEFTPDTDKNLPPDIEDGNTLPVCFNINYYRPHVFGLEAEPVVSAFIQHFNLSVSDYQVTGMGEGEYTPLGFLRGWNCGNEVGYKGLLQNEKTAPFPLPAQQIEVYWKWNYSREEFQESLGDDIFVPRIMFISLGGIVEPVIIWTDGIPTIIPELNIYLIYRQKTTGFFGKNASFAIINKQQLNTLLSKFQTLECHLPYHKLEYRNTPKEIESFIKSLPPYQVELKNVTQDHILDKELVDKYYQSSVSPC
jgi:hypothetical protein